MEKILFSVCILMIIAFGFKKAPLVVASVQTTDSVLVGFKNFSVNIHNENGNKVMHVTMNGTDGKIYEMDKTNSEISAFWSIIS